MSDTMDEFDAEQGAGTFEASEHSIKAYLENRKKVKQAAARQRRKENPTRWFFQDVAMPAAKKAGLVGIPAYYLATLIQGSGYIDQINYTSLAIASVVAYPVLQGLANIGEALGHYRGHATNAVSAGRFQEVDDRAEARGALGAIGYTALVISPAVGIEKIANITAQIGVDAANLTYDFGRAIYYGYQAIRGAPEVHGAIQGTVDQVASAAPHALRLVM